jgi:hypothetical protein
MYSLSRREWGKLSQLKRRDCRLSNFLIVGGLVLSLMGYSDVESGLRFCIFPAFKGEMKSVDG